MYDRYKPQPKARWFTAAAVASLLFMGLGCATYLMHVTANPASLPLDQRAALEAEPMWVTAAYALAVWLGLAGSILLLMNRKPAQWLLLASLVAVTAWLAGLLFVPGLRNIMTPGEFAVSLVVTALTWTIFWFAHHSAQRGWLR